MHESGDCAPTGQAEYDVPSERCPPSALRHSFENEPFATELGDCPFSLSGARRYCPEGLRDVKDQLLVRPGRRFFVLEIESREDCVKDSREYRSYRLGGGALDTTLFGINQCGQLTVQVPFEASSVLRSPGPFASLAASTWSLTDLVYSARSMLRNTPNGVGE